MRSNWLPSKEKKIRQKSKNLNRIKRVKEERKTLFAQWSQEKEVVDSYQQTKSEIENLKSQADRAEREGDYGTVAEIRYGKLQESEDQNSKLQETLQ